MRRCDRIGSAQKSTSQSSPAKTKHAYACACFGATHANNAPGKETSRLPIRRQTNPERHPEMVHKPTCGRRRSSRRFELLKSGCPNKVIRRNVLRSELFIANPPGR